jgi:methylated-DNA-protein-cysteine methyltransferase-like protein
MNVGCYSGHRVIESSACGAETLNAAQRPLQTKLFDRLDPGYLAHSAPVMSNPTNTPAQRAAAIRKAVRAIGRGSFVSYGEVARRARLPGRARLVGQVLRESGDAPRLPWHRVTGAGGRIAFPAGSKNAREQLRRLAREGVRARGQRVVPRPSAASARTLDALLWKV